MLVLWCAVLPAERAVPDHCTLTHYILQGAQPRGGGAARIPLLVRLLFLFQVYHVCMCSPSSLALLLFVAACVLCMPGMARNAAVPLPAKLNPHFNAR